MKNNKEFQLDFIGIGSGKCGSTWIYENIVKHPEVCNCNLKELNYFSDLYEAHSCEWYASQFSGCENNLVKGEFSVTYMGNSHAAERIMRHFPHVKIIAIVRDPVKRTFSNYLHSIRKGDTDADLSFADYISEESRLLPAKYVEHLQSFYKVFPADQIHVIVLEEFVRDVSSGLRDIYSFIGVDDTLFLPDDYGRRSNVAKAYRYPWIEKILIRSYRWLSRRGYTRLVKKIVDSGGAKVIRSLNSDDRPLPEIEVTVERELMDYFAPYNEKLAEILGQDLGCWSREYGEADDIRCKAAGNVHGQEST